jgi:hypothetical protein
LRYIGGEVKYCPDYILRISSHGIPYTSKSYGKGVKVVPKFKELGYEYGVDTLKINVPSMNFKVMDLGYDFIARSILEGI